MSDDDKWGAGDRSKWSDHGTVMLRGREYPLIYGEHPHSRQDNKHYAVVNGEPVGFDGHRVLIGVSLVPNNYLKESHLSGDEIRKGGTGQILADGLVVYEFFFRDTQWALLEAHRLIGVLSEHSSFWLQKRERENLVGRKVWYRQNPAVIESLVVSQGCVMLRREDGASFDRPVWSDDNYYFEGESSIKTEVLDPAIWWFRK